LREPPVVIRAIRAADLPLLRSFVQNLSRDTSYQRLLSPRTPTEEELRRWTDIDPDREGAVVATTTDSVGRESLAGVARYVKEMQDSADFAIVLADAWQGKGLGRTLMVRLIAAAKEHGVRRLTGLTLASNIPMLLLARSLGFHTRRDAGGL